MWLWIQLDKDWKLHGTGRETNFVLAFHRSRIESGCFMRRKLAPDAAKEGLDHYCGGEEVRRYKVGRWLIGSGW